MISPSSELMFGDVMVPAWSRRLSSAREAGASETSTAALMAK